MRITLATLHARDAFIPLALLYLKAFLVEREGRAAGDIAVCEFTRSTTAADVARELLATNPDVIGLSCYVWNITRFMTACALVKQARPAVVIVLGGPEVGPVGEHILATHPSVDVVVKSEGEIPFAAIVRALDEDVPLDAIPGLWLRTGGVIVDTGEAPILKDLNTLPSPHTAEYADHSGRRIVCIETQRGCVFNCNFCFYNKDLSIRNRRFDLDRVKKEILFWINRDVREIFLMDPIFNLKAERAKEICRFIVGHNHRGTEFHAEVWAEFIDAELAELMRRANFTVLEVGLQTTDETALAAVDRRLKLAPFLDGIAHLKRNRLPFELQLIYGLPGETPESFRRSLDFAARLDPPRLAVFLLMVLPGTELWRKAAAIGLKFHDDPPYFVTSHQEMSEDDIRHGDHIVDVLEVIGSSRAFLTLCREPDVAMSQVVDEWIDWEAAAPRPQSPGQKAREFIAHFCASRQIPPAFYDAFASREFSVTPSATGSTPAPPA